MSASGNILITALGQDDLRLLEPSLRRIELEEGAVLATAGDKIETLCFIEGGVASYSRLSSGGERTGIAMAGFEGVVGWDVMLGNDRHPYDVAVAVGGGTALCISAETVIDACRRSVSLQRLLMHFVQSFFAQVSQTAISNVADPVRTRLCRWLLMNHDRLEGDDIHLSHDEIGHMLCVRRASVTDALHVLEGDGLISARRKRITVRDRPGLRESGGEYYGFAESEYSRLITPFGKGG